MNFSRKGTIQKEKDIKSTGKRLSTKTGVSIFRIIIVSLVAVVIIGCFAVYGAVKAIIDKAPDVKDIGLNPTGFTTTIYDIDGNEIDTLVGAESNRIYKDIEEIPKVVQDAFVAIEDERFYQHNGIDVRGIFRAFFQGLSRGHFGQGASTITQQLIKNQVFGGGNEANLIEKFERKIQEQYLAIKLESIGDKTEVKKEILERYLNTINCGQGTYGVQTASKRYFNKDVGELTLSEAAVLAVITNRPVYYNPITYPEDNARRRLACLDLMLELGFCTQAEYDEAIADTDDVYKRIQAVNDETNDNSYNSYFVDALIDQVLQDLMEIGYSQSEASNYLYTKGLQIYSTQDTQIQNIVDDVYSDESLFPAIGVHAYYELKYALSVEYPDGRTVHYQTSDLEKYYQDDSSFKILFVDKDAMQAKIDAFKDSVYNKKAGDVLLGEKVTMTIQPQSSFVVMDQHTGYVNALVGGVGAKEGNRTLNRATSTPRQPGSTFKILSTYLPALDTAGLTLATTFDDDKFYYPGTNSEVRNYDRSSYQGLTTIREAITRSMNIIAVKTLNMVTPQVGYDYLLKLGFTTLVDNNDGSGYSDIALPLALGGITKGVTNLELTAAYAAIANSGTYQKPTLYTKILDQNGNVLINKTKPKSEQVMKESTAWLLTSAMKDVIAKSSGTGYRCRFTKITMPVAGKSGTTSNYLDTWFSGYTPYYTGTIWSGYDNNNLSQTEKNYHKNVWKEIMERIHIEKNLEAKDFPMPDSIETATICTKSGKLAADGICNEAQGGSTVRTEYFAKGTKPTEKCDVHKKVTICKESGLLSNEFCPADEVEERVFIEKPEETATTADTPYLIPTEECKIHNVNNTGPAEDDIPDDTLPPENDHNHSDNNGNQGNGNRPNNNENGNQNNNNNVPGDGSITNPTLPPSNSEPEPDDPSDTPDGNTPEPPLPPVTPDSDQGGTIE